MSTATDTRTPAEFLSEVVVTAWTNDMIARGAITPADIPQEGDDEHQIAVDADCPGCDWPERTYDTATRRFGCVRCEYTSDERNA